MKIQLITLSVVLSIFSISSVVEAGGRHSYYNYYKKNDRHNHKYDFGHSFYKKHYRKQNSHYSYGRHRKRNKYDNHGYNAAYALGGLIVGGVLGATIANSYSSDNQSFRYRERHVNPYQGNVNNNSSSSYVLQPNGSCYVVDHVSNGKLVLSPVLTYYCQ